MVRSFRDKPERVTARWVTRFGLVSLLAPVLGVVNGFFRKVFDPVSANNERIRIPMGLGGVVFALIFSITAMVMGTRAYKQGERSWVLGVGFALAILVSLFWSFMIAGELLFPH